jgi:hypothetical protein
VAAHQAKLGQPGDVVGARIGTGACSPFAAFATLAAFTPCATLATLTALTTFTALTALTALTTFTAFAAPSGELDQRRVGAGLGGFAEGAGLRGLGQQ